MLGSLAAEAWGVLDVLHCAVQEGAGREVTGSGSKLGEGEGEGEERRLRARARPPQAGRESGRLSMEGMVLVLELELESRPGLMRQRGIL